jgi:chromate transport protein ChrA
MRGISLGVVGISLTVAWTIIHQRGIDWTGWLIALAAFGLAFSRRVGLIVILLLAGLAGCVLYR